MNYSSSACMRGMTIELPASMAFYTIPMGATHQVPLIILPRFDQTCALKSPKRTYGSSEGNSLRACWRPG